MSGTGHTVKSYEEEMQSLNDNLVMMGSLTESQMADAMAAVIKVDKDSVDKIVKNDGKINELRSVIDNQITTVLVKRAPMAVDLRITISTMKISHDLERIGDLAKSVAKKVKPLPVDLVITVSGYVSFHQSPCLSISTTKYLEPFQFTFI